MELRKRRGDYPSQRYSGEDRAILQQRHRRRDKILERYYTLEAFNFVRALLS